LIDEKFFINTTELEINMENINEIDENEIVFLDQIFKKINLLFELKLYMQ